MPKSYPQWITTDGAADLWGYHVEHLRGLLRAGHLPGQVKGRLVWVDCDGLKGFLTETAKSGV